MDVIFYVAKYGNYVDKLVSWFTFGPYSHCEIRFSNKECFSSSKRDKGTRFKNIYFIPSHWRIVHIRASLEKEQEIYDWCKQECGKPYDLLGVFGLMTFPKLNDKNRWYCSEICSHILNKFLNAHIPEKITPNNLYKAIISDPML